MSLALISAIMEFSMAECSRTQWSASALTEDVDQLTDEEVGESTKWTKMISVCVENALGVENNSRKLGSGARGQEKD